MWFQNLLKELKNRDDEMTQKKRPMCTMTNEHREYFVQNMPLERMNCVGKNLALPNRNNGNYVCGKIIGLFASFIAVQLI
jgi:hypothetical protein